MAHRKDVTKVTMTIQHKNARLYEYLYGALLESEARTETENDMIAYRQKTIAYLDGLDHATSTGNQTDQKEFLLTEIKLNTRLLQTVRECQSALWEKHGYGRSTVRCAAKWVFQDFPAMLARSLSSRQPLTFLCKHILDNYNCISDPIVADICSRLDNEPLPYTVLHKPSADEKQADNCESDKHSEQIATSDGEHTLNLDHKTSGFDIEVVDMPTERVSIRPLIISGSTNYKDDAEAIEAERLVLNKIRVIEALEKLQTTMSPDLDTVTGPVSSASADMPPANVTDKPTKRHVRYWPPFSKHPTVSINNVIEDFQTLLEQISKPKAPPCLHDDNKKPGCAKLDLTQLDPEFGVSSCSVRASRMTPLRAPVKKGKKSDPVPCDEEIPDYVSDVNNEPYVKPWFKKRISHVTQALNERVGVGTEDQWKAFHACLEAVRQRVIEKLKPKIVTNTSDGVTETSKKKKRKKKTKRKRKCRKHSKTKQCGSNTDSIVRTSNDDVSIVDHVAQTCDVTTTKKEVCLENRNAAKYVQHKTDKKLRRKKKCRRKAKEEACNPQVSTPYKIAPTLATPELSSSTEENSSNLYSHEQIP